MAEKRKASEAYLAKLRDPRWQKKRLEVMQRDEFMCQICYDADSTLNVHHRYYLVPFRDPWDYPLEALVTLCESCHHEETFEMKNSEALLVRAFKAHFFSRSVGEIAMALWDTEKLPHTSDLWASVVAHAFRDREIQDLMIERYFAWLKAKAEAEKAARESDEAASHG